MHRALTLAAALLSALALPLAAVGAELKEMNWDELIPADFNPDKLLQGADIDNLPDDDPKVVALMKQVEAMWKTAPVVKTLEGREVKLSGYAVPLEGDGEKVTDFLLVPYFGACIHVPPPPANQIVLVKVGQGGAKVRQQFDTVTVTGRMHIERTAGALGTAGYRLDASKVEELKE